MSRADLLALTPEALASLANLGLVKRAQRELASGATPSLREEDDGTIVGAFVDGVVARLPPSTPLKEAPCTCGATGVCRHRIAVALAYGPWHTAEHEGKVAPPSARLPETWSPAEIDDPTLERALGPKGVERARATLRGGLVVTVEREGTPTAKLPSCTVRFLVPRDVAYARCDCAQVGGGCEHLALAVWAFRAAKGTAPSEIVALGSAVERDLDDVLEDVMALTREILVAGIAESAPSPARFAQLRSRLERAGVTWAHSIVVDLERALEGYHKRSALHGTREIAELLVELAARVRAGRRDGHELPRRFVLGQDEAPETLLDHVRLVSLGARIRADGRTRFADVYLADPDTALVLVLRKRWDFDEGTEPDDGPALARRPVAARVALKALAHGQLVSKVVTRRANRAIDLGTSRVAQTSVTPQRGEWSHLPAPLLVRDLGDHEARLRNRPPRVLRPRVLAEEVHAIEVSGVRDVLYSSAEQTLLALLTDSAGRPFHLVVRHRRAAPHAIDAVAAALAGSVRFVAGELVRSSSGWELDPIAIAGDDLVIPDIAASVSAPTPAPFVSQVQRDPVDEALAQASAALEETCHVGLSSWSRAAIDRVASAAQRLEDAGLSALAKRVRTLTERRGPSATNAAAEAWIDASVRLTLTREARAR